MTTNLWNPFQKKVPVPLLWQDQKVAYDGSGNIIYIGLSVVHDPSTVTGDYWWIIKITYDVSNNITDIEGPLTGNWDSRTTLGWKV